MNNQESGFFKFMSGLLLGILGGFVAGVLTADRPGRELRKEIGINSSDMLEKLRERIDEIKDQASDKLGDFRHFADENLRTSAMDIQDKVADLGRQLDALTATPEEANK